MKNIVTLGQINDALKIASVTAAQLAEMGFAALENKPICEGLPPEESRRLRSAKLYPVESIAQIRVALAKRLAAPAACLRQIQEPAANQQLTVAPVAAMTNALREAEAALEVSLARILKADAGHSISVTSETKALVAVRQALSAQAAPVTVGEREAFEAWARSYGSWEVKRDDDQALGTTGYTDLTLTVAWHAIQGRAALAATPAEGFDAGNTGNKTPVPKWIDDPHDIEQGQMRNPEWVKLQETTKPEDHSEQTLNMVNMTPPATSRDRWMYEQGRLAERDARTAPQAQADVRDAAAASEQDAKPLIARSLTEWHEDDGPVSWWAWCGREWAGEAAWIGTPNCDNWPGYHTHWTAHPEFPTAIAAQAAQQGGAA